MNQVNAHRLPNGKISGSGTIIGGVYDHISVSGSGVLDGDVEANSISISGSGTARGNVRAGDLKVSGSAKFERNLSGGHHKVSGSTRVLGQMYTDEVHVSGSMKVLGLLHSQEVHVSGSLSCQGLKTNRLEVSGSLHSKADLEAEEFRGKGSFRVEGLLNANHLDFAFGGGSYAKEIGGEYIRVIQWHGFGFNRLLSWFIDLLGFRKYSHLRADLIEGTVVELDHADVKVVRGTRVVIGPNCKIGLVEFTDSLLVDPSSEVSQRVQM
ncbi:MAG: hypothetical protein H7X86_11630 [Gorillibacterium sp.]|nr:hypothetical protein [Gorillibacterium sp.]